MSAKILRSAWRTGGAKSFGIVAVERVDGWKAYLGLVDGFDESRDEQSVAASGAPLMESEARGFFPGIDRPYAS